MSDIDIETIREKIRKNIGQLTDREKKILVKKFGIDVSKGVDLGQVSEKFDEIIRKETTEK